MQYLSLFRDRPKDLSTYLAPAIFISGLLLLFWRLSYVTVWSDEFTGTLRLLPLSWKELLAGRYSWDLNPPFYFLALKSWTSLLGSQDEVTLRLFSVLLSAGGMIVAYYLGCTLGSSRAGLALMAVLAYHPIFQFYATELRMYPLWIMFCLLTFFFFARYVFSADRSPWRLALMSLCLTLAAYTHYFSALLFLGIGLFGLFAWAGGKIAFRPILVSLAGAGVLVLPLVQILYRKATWYTGEFVNESIVNAPMNAGSFLAQLSGSVTSQFKLTDIAQILGLAAVFCGALVLYRAGQKWLGLSLLLFIGLSWTFGFIVSVWNFPVSPRHLLPASLATWILIALGLDAQGQTLLSRLSRGVSLATILVTAFAGLYGAFLRQYSFPDWRAIAQILNQEARTSEPVVILGWDASPVGYYLDGPWLTSYELEEQLMDRSEDSYLIVDSPHARRLEWVKNMSILYDDPQQGVRILRFEP